MLLLNISKTYSDSDCWETNLRVSPFKGDQLCISSKWLKNSMQFTLAMPFLGVLGKFYRNLKGLKCHFYLRIKNVESLCSWITELQKISNEALWQLQIWKTKGREQKTLNSNKEPFWHKRVLQNSMVLNITITACKEPFKDHIFLEREASKFININASKYLDTRSAFHHAWC